MKGSSSNTINRNLIQWLKRRWFTSIAPVFAIYQLHISHDKLYLPPNFCITIVSNFSWVLQSSQEKNLGGNKKVMTGACNEGIHDQNREHAFITLHKISRPWQMRQSACMFCKILCACSLVGRKPSTCQMIAVQGLANARPPGSKNLLASYPVARGDGRRWNSLMHKT